MTRAGTRRRPAEWLMVPGEVQPLTDAVGELQAVYDRAPELREQVTRQLFRHYRGLCRAWAAAAERQK